VQRVVDLDSRLDVLYDPELLPEPRYPADHGGARPELSPAQDAKWSSMLAAADVSFDLDWRAPADLPTSAPSLRWMQATSAGVGQLLQRTGLDQSSIAFTTAAGVHAVPLAEFALTGVLHFAKGIPLLRARQQARHWERYATTSVRGRRALVVGLEVWGVGRPGRSYDVPAATRLLDTEGLDAALLSADVVVLACPLTEQTRGLLSRHRLGLLPAGAIVVNIARGQAIDEQALLDALERGRLGGAALDVFVVEPLPASSPFWGRDDVLVSPHSASTLPSENPAIVDLFCDNLRRFLDGRPLRNLYRPEDGY
jgi:glyoxylate/hydroxypyruvate reductase A